MTILYEDDHILTIHKPAGLLAQPDRTGDVDVLTVSKRRLRENEEDDPFVGLVHRLDRPTSGIMILARNSDAARSLSEQFRERTVEKTYLALLEGELSGIGQWTDYVAKLNQQPQLVSPDHPDGRRAELRWQVVSGVGSQTLVQVTLRTGRPHQIRLQASEREHPIVGDTRYGGTQSWKRGRIALHHAILRVDHPSNARRETFVAPLPDPWRQTLSDGMNATVDRLLAQARPTS